MKNRFNITEEEKSRIKSLHNIKLINEQWTEVEMEEQPDLGGEPPHGLQKYEEDHEKFMTDLHSMCGQIEDMGNKMVGRRKCDGNTTDGSGGCYEPLIKLVKQYCKSAKPNN